MKESKKTSYSYDVFEISPEKQHRFTVLRTPEQPNVMALTEIPDLEPITEIPRRSTIVLETPEIDRIVSASKKMGLKVYPEDKLVTKDGREGREVGIVDADGNLVIIYLITKDAI